MNLLELTIETYHQALQNGQITAEKLVNYYLDRIQKFDSALHSIICINPQALSHARQLDKQFSETHVLSGHLHGVPVLVKDNIETKEMPTTAGSLTLANFRSGNDADLVRKLREAGAIILAKTNMHEFAIGGLTFSSIKGQTLNPYDLTRTPGGSSGGTAVALAANFGLVGIGTDTINSVRSPLSANNLAGIRPTIGIVSGIGVVPYSHTQDTAGPMARTIVDAAILLSVITSHSKIKPIMPTSQYNHWRIGVLKSFFGTQPENRNVNKVMRQVLTQFESLGVDVVGINENIDLNDILNNICVHLYEFVHDLDAYLAHNSAPVSSVKEILQSESFHPGIRDNLLAALKLAFNGSGYSDRLKRRKGFQKKMSHLLKSEGLDALIFPHELQIVCKVGDPQLQRNGALAAITGFPSICLQAGFSQVSTEAQIGVPIGFELVGLPFSESNLIKLASLFEQNFPKRRPPSEELWL